MLAIPYRKFHRSIDDSIKMYKTYLSIACTGNERYLYYCDTS